MFLHLYSYFWRMFGYVEMVFGSIPKTWRGSRWFYVGLHLLLVAIVFVVLCIFSNRIVDENLIDINIWFVRRFWSGIVFLLAYLSIRLLVFLISLLRASRDSDWPEIDLAWSHCLDELEKNGLDYNRIPIFLVTGSTNDIERQFVESLQLHWKVVCPPVEQISPMRMFADQEAIFMFCSNISASSLQSEYTPQDSQQSKSLGQAVNPANSRHIGSQTVGQDMRGIMSAAPEESSRNEDSSSSSKAAGMSLSSLVSAVKSTLDMSKIFGGSSNLNAARNRQSVRIISNYDMEKCRYQMMHLLKLMYLKRTVCPFNGLMQFIPYSWLDLSHQHHDLVRSIHVDWHSISAELSFQFPVITVFSGLERLQGFSNFVRKCQEVDPGIRLQRAGTSYPPAAKYNDDASTYLTYRCVTSFRNLVFPVLAKNINDNNNGKAYRFLCEFADRDRRLEMMMDALMNKNDSSLWSLARYHGCYFSATGQNPEDQAFLFGTIAKLLQDQNQVAYTPAKTAKDRFLKTIAYGVFALSTLLIVGAGYLSWLIWQESQKVKPVDLSGINHLNQPCLSTRDIHSDFSHRPLISESTQQPQRPCPHA